MNASGKLSIETLANPQQHAGAQNVEQALERIKPRSKHDEPHQRGYAATCQNAVIDLKHEQRRDERKHVDHAADQHNAPNRGSQREGSQS
ncbi:hypothetical protein X744_32535 [Mesorhizobium sp. LNJC372A00]|nr:hypothetical protein X744_32535 [Mesorhizobium sp. LNJC372A00]